MAIQEEGMFNIYNFSGGLNEYATDNLLKPSEAVYCRNCNVDGGSLKPISSSKVILTASDTVQRILPYYNDSVDNFLYTSNKNLYAKDKSLIKNLNSALVDSLNFEYKGKKVLIGTSYLDGAFLIDGKTYKRLKNRRISYNDEGEIDGYIDANGVKKKTEEEINTFAPSGAFIELHYDRLWIAGNTKNPDRVYFSTASINGADIEDWTVPIEEAEANQHGGFIDVRSYDGGKIIGMKVIFNNVVIFKNKTAYKIFGNSPDNYELVQLFSSNGAIADKSICVGNNGAYFLNNDGIYFYDGTNTNLISQKIQKTLKKLNQNYANESVGYFYDNKYYLAIPTGDSSKNNLLIEFNALTNSFVLHDMTGITSFEEVNNKLLLSSGNEIKSLNEGEYYYTMIWETPNYDYGTKNSRKNSNYIYFRGKGNGSVRFRVITEKKEKSIEIPLTNTEVLYKKKLKNKGRMFKIIIENVNNSYVEIINPQLLTEIDLD